MNHKGQWEGYIVSFPPSFARTFSSKERRLGTRQPWGPHFRAPFTALTQNFYGIIFRFAKIPESHTLK